MSINGKIIDPVIVEYFREKLLGIPSDEKEDIMRVNLENDAIWGTITIWLSADHICDGVIEFKDCGIDEFLSVMDELERGKHYVNVDLDFFNSRYIDRVKFTPYDKEE